MLDKTLAGMIDETLRTGPEMGGFCSRKMLEVPVNQAHLSSLQTRPRSHSNPGNFIRDLFTIGCFEAFA